MWQQVQTPDKRGSPQNTCRTHLTPHGPQVRSPQSDPGSEASQRTERESQTDKYTERETDRKTATQGEREKQRHTYRAETETETGRGTKNAAGEAADGTGGRRVEAPQPPPRTVQAC